MRWHSACAPLSGAIGASLVVKMASICSGAAWQDVHGARELTRFDVSLTPRRLVDIEPRMQISGAALGPISERATIKMKLRHIILSMTFLVSGCVGLVSLTRTERETYPKRAFGMYCPDLANIGEFRL